MRNLRIGLLLGLRQIQRANKWTTLLIIFVMMFTFLNLIAVSGILVGLITGAERAVKAEALGDLILTEKDSEDRLLDTESILRELATYPEIEAFSVRYTGGGELEAHYKERRSLTAERDIAQVTVTGVDPILEDQMSGLSDTVIKGEYLDPNEEGYILIGYYYLEEFAEQFGDIFDTIANVEPGDTVRLTVGDISKELIVKGIIQSKVDQVSLNTYITEREFRRLFGRLDRNADQIVIRVKTPGTEATLKKLLLPTDLIGSPKYKLTMRASLNS